MEAFESFVALAMETEGLVVSEAVKFKVALKTKKKDTVEIQEHGYEVDLVAARADKLVLASVKSFFGSQGVKAKEVAGIAGTVGDSGYKMLNRPEVRDGILAEAAKAYGYKPEQIEFRLYVGHFNSVPQELATREWCESQFVGAGPIKVFTVDEIVDVVKEKAASKTYLNNPALVALKVLQEAEQYTAKKAKYLADLESKGKPKPKRPAAKMALLKPPFDLATADRHEVLVWAAQIVDKFKKEISNVRARD